MAVFTYLARDNGGALVQGDVTAATPIEAARLVRGEGKFVVKVGPKGSVKAPARAKPAMAATSSGAPIPAHREAAGVKEEKAGKDGVIVAPRGGKYRSEDLIFFTNQLAVMIETGVSMVEALDACVHDGNSPRFARALDDVIERVQGGAEFSAALAIHPRVFPAIYVSLMKASEASGTMGPMLRRLATHLEMQRDTRKKIKGAVTYPIVMFVFAIGVTIFLMTFVLPKFSNIYAGREDKLPAITRWLMAFSDFLVQYCYYIVGCLAAVVGGAVYYFRTPAGRLKLETLRLSVPLIGPLFHKAYLARSLRTLGTMLQSGVSMLDGVKLTSGVCGSAIYERMWNGVYERLEAGQQLSETLADTPQVPRAVNKMLSAGERSGQLGPVMERVAIYCESELNISLKTLTSMIEPAIVMFLGAVVGGLVLALLLPIFTISKALH